MAPLPEKNIAREPREVLHYREVGLETGVDEKEAYARALLSHESVRRWRAMGVADGYVQPVQSDGSTYEFDLPARANPHDPAVTGRAVMGQEAENPHCPFSGRDVSSDSLVEIEGRTIGFCNPFCRDKVAADPYAWPEVRDLLT